MTRNSLLSLAAGTVFVFAAALTGCGSSSSTLPGDEQDAGGSSNPGDIPGSSLPGTAGNNGAGGNSGNAGQSGTPGTGGAKGGTGGMPGGTGGAPGMPGRPDGGAPRPTADGGPRGSDAGPRPDGGAIAPACTAGVAPGQACKTGDRPCESQNDAGANEICSCRQDKWQCQVLQPPRMRRDGGLRIPDGGFVRPDAGRVRPDGGGADR